MKPVSGSPCGKLICLAWGRLWVRVQAGHTKDHHKIGTNCLHALRAGFNAHSDRKQAGGVRGTNN